MFPTSLRHQKHAKSLLIVVLLGLVILPSNKAMSADQVIKLMQVKDASPELKVFARHFLLKEWDDSDILRRFRWGGDGERFSVDQDVRITEFDLNGDGLPERILRVEAGVETCGSAGCRILVLKKDGRRWRVIFDTVATDIAVLDQTDFGYHRLCDGFLQAWNGERYFSMPSGKPADDDLNQFVKCDR
jgi:hypothetical protein